MTTEYSRNNVVISTELLVWNVIKLMGATAAVIPL